MVYEREQERCARCGRTAQGGSGHHRKPRGMGGTVEPDTCSRIVLLCGSGTTGCHGWVERFREQAYDQGWLVRRWQDCEQIPIQHALYGLVCLLNNGQVVSPTTGEIGTGWVPQPVGHAIDAWVEEPVADVDDLSW